MKMRIFHIFVIAFVSLSIGIWAAAFTTNLSDSPEFIRTKVQNEFDVVLRDSIKDDELRKEFIGIVSDKLCVGNLIFAWMGIEPSQAKLDDLRGSYYLYQTLDDRKRNS